MKKIFGFLTSRLFILFALIGVQAFLLVSFLYELQADFPALQFILIGVSVFLALYIISKRQDPYYKLAWMIPVLLLPLLGVMMYFFFSQRQMDRKYRGKLEEVYQKSLPYLRQDRQVRLQVEAKAKGVARVSGYIRNTCFFPMYDKTHTEYFPMGEAFFERLLSELRQAKRFIYMEYFIVAQGYMWDSILEILEQKAADGVDVRFMYDDIGCMNRLPRYYYRTLRKKGIKCEVFNRLRPVLNSLFNNRSHRKITVIDGHTAFVSGANLADEYINKTERFGVWKDSALMMKGNAAWGFLMMFLQMWEFFSTDCPDPASLLPETGFPVAAPTDGYVQPFEDSPMDDANISENVFLSLIGRARDYIYITTPYLILNDSLMNALCTAAQSGVDVRIMTPHIPDKKGVFLMTRANYKELVSHGVQIFEYTPGFLHSKNFVCDDELAIVGSINLDYRSLFLNFECAALLYQASTVADVKKDFLQTQEICELITMEQIKAQPWYIRFAQLVLRPFAPLF